MIIAIWSPVYHLVELSVATQKKTVALILNDEKTVDDIDYIRKSLAINRKQTQQLAIFTKRLSRILPLKSIVKFTDALANASAQLPQLLGAGGESNLVLMFLNNYELRPGGGFIGSLGFVTFKEFSITRFEVQDIYEIDGQITTHFEPHYAVRKYLNQPNEFLRDSNFSPDFGINAKNALNHLSRVPAYNKTYVATIGITTTAFEQLLQLTGPIELPDYNITVTSSNFFSTTQRKIESDFFPGSKQKRSILQSLGNVMRQRVADVPPSDIFVYLYKSIKSRDLVFFTPNSQLKNIFTLLDATGSQNSSQMNWIMPVDANVGVNKMDALVHKVMDLRLSQSGGVLIHTFKSTYTNTITTTATEKESYKNYFQLYVPTNATLRKVVLGGKDVSDETIITQENGNTVFALYFETPPAANTTISLTYDLPIRTQSNQIHFQKQIGSKSSPLTVIYQGKTTKAKQRLLESDEVFIF